MSRRCRDTSEYHNHESHDDEYPYDPEDYKGQPQQPLTPEEIAFYNDLMDDRHD